MAVMLSEARWCKVEKILETIAKSNVNWINDEEVCKLLKITPRTLATYIHAKKIPPNCYTIAVTGKRVFDKNKLLNQ